MGGESEVEEAENLALTAEFANRLISGTYYRLEKVDGAEKAVARRAPVVGARRPASAF